MKTFRLSLLTAVIAAPLLFHPAPAVAAPPAPNLTSKSAGFSIWLPGKAQVNSKTTQTNGLGKVTVNFYSVKTPSIAYVVLPIDLPGAITPSAMTEYLDGVQRGFTQTQGAKLVSRKSISLNGARGRELVVNANGNQIRGHFYAVGKKAYQVMAIAPMKNVASQTALTNKVFSSFRILP